MEVQNKFLKSSFRIVKQALKQSLDKVTDNQNLNLILTPQMKGKEDYQCPSAVRLFNEFKKDGQAFGFQSAHEMAEKIVQNLQESEVFDKIEINKAGFLLIKVKESFTESEINKILRNGVHLEQQQDSRILVDFSSPNIAKQMHAGHLRSTIIGESICRVFEFIGADVHRVNHLGDWGTQFGMLIEFIRENVKDIDDDKYSLDDILEFYKNSKKVFDSDPDFKKRSQQRVVQLQSYDPECIKIWELLTKITMKQNNLLYKRMDINVNDFGESYYNKMIPGAVQECQDKGIVKLDEGAQCIYCEGFEVPLIVVKKDGGYNYDSTDLAAIRHRLTDLNRNRLIYVTDLGQEGHFHKIFKASAMMGWSNQNTTLNHVGFGLVQGKDGKKFKTREGDTVKLLDLLDEAVKMSYQDLQNRSQKQDDNQKTNISNEQEMKETAEKIGISAIKYFDLKQNRKSDYRFDYSKMLDFKGNTAVYLFYSYVRMCSVIKKSGLSEQQIQELAIKEGFKFTHDHEKVIGSQLSKFSECIDLIVDDLELHKLCDYVYSLTVRVSEGYSKYRILEDKDTNTRLMLCLAVKRVLEKSFLLLGLTPVQKI